jgi:hypothetical protein
MVSKIYLPSKYRFRRGFKGVLVLQEYTEQQDDDLGPIHFEWVDVLSNDVLEHVERLEDV